MFIVFIVPDTVADIWVILADWRHIDSFISLFQLFSCRAVEYGLAFSQLIKLLVGIWGPKHDLSLWTGLQHVSSHDWVTVVAAAHQKILSHNLLILSYSSLQGCHISALYNLIGSELSHAFLDSRLQLMRFPLWSLLGFALLAIFIVVIFVIVFIHHLVVIFNIGDLLTVDIMGSNLLLLLAGCLFLVVVTSAFIVNAGSTLVLLVAHHKSEHTVDRVLLSV